MIDKGIVIETGIKCLRDESQALLNIIQYVNDDFYKAVELIYKCKGKFIITGVGKSGHVGAKIAATLASLGTPSFFVNPLDAFHGDLGMFDSNDVLMAISHSGNTDELLRFLPMLIERNIPIIGMTGNTSSLLAKHSVCLLNVTVGREADPLNLAPTSSTTAQMAMGDALACAMVKVRNFTETDFARFHPGGSLGKRLLTRVKDVMESSNLPSAYGEEEFCNIIMKVSEGKKGLVCILENGTKAIKGIITDGDIRRAMQKYGSNSFKLKASDIMTLSPKTISEEEKIEVALRIMQKNSIHSLLVADNENQYLGIIDYLSCGSSILLF
jgi:arabinose-5-phosphate isomerase